jgi:hypothetical protein
MKTSQDIVTDFINLLKGSALAEYAAGSIYRQGIRPRNSIAEDIVVMFSGGLTNQVQEGTVTITIWVQDIEGVYGALLPNIARIRELEHFAAEWVKSIQNGKAGGYFTRLARTIETYEDISIKQHFISVAINYKIVETN